VGVTLLLALGAFNSQNNLLFWAFGFALAVLIVSGVVSGFMLMGVTVRRTGMARVQAGEVAEIRYALTNRNRFWPAFALSIHEHAPSVTPVGLLARLLSRPVTPPRPSPLGPALAFVAHIAPGQTVTVAASVPALRRGEVVLTGVVIHSGFPFGLMRKLMRFDQPGSGVVLPRIIPPAQGALAAVASPGMAQNPMRRVGPGDEFHSLREYRPGDPLRDIAWRASATRPGLVVRQTSVNAPQRVWIVPVLRSRPGSDEADELAIGHAAGLAVEAERRGLEYALLVPLTGTLITPRRGQGHLDRVLLELALLDLGPDDGRGAALGDAPAPGPGLRVLVTADGPALEARPSAPRARAGVPVGARP
jgi:uncharacterized protein (DUF58 family)